MRTFEISFWDRDDPSLSAMLDERVDMLAGLRVPNFAAGANLKMTAPMDELNRWRKNRKHPLGITASVAAALRWALESDGLFASLFDGRDNLLVPDNPSIGVGVDAGNAARIMVVSGEEYSDPLDLADKIEASKRDIPTITPVPFSPGSKEKASNFAKRKRWAKMVKQELQERFDYLLPPLQKRRFDTWASQRGHIQLHNLGTHGVQEFKGLLRRPWVSMLWVLEKDEIVSPGDSGEFVSSPVLPLILVYAQELIPVDRACTFLSKVVEALTDPKCLEDRR